jgi:hypothetical protein
MHGHKFHSLARREFGKKNWPHVTDSHDFDPEVELSNSRRDIVDSARAVGFEDVDEANVDEFLRSHTEELTNEDLLELEKDLNEKGDESSVVERVKLLSTKQTAEFFKHIHTAISIIDENDPNRERSAKVARDIQSSLACYKELYRERKNAAYQLTLDHFFNIAKTRQSTDPGPSKERKNYDPDSPVSFDSSSD